MKADEERRVKLTKTILKVMDKGLERFEQAALGNKTLMLDVRLGARAIRTRCGCIMGMVNTLMARQHTSQTMIISYDEETSPHVAVKTCLV